MKSIFLSQDRKAVWCGEKEEPEIKHSDEVKLRVLEVGICGTDRELVAGGRKHIHSREKDLVLGHEMLAEVVAVGSGVGLVKRGDLAIVTVRRGCNQCSYCIKDRADLCSSGEYLERGIKGLDGFQSEYVVDKEKFIVKVPPFLREFGVLCEPTSVVEKAVEKAVTIQGARLPEWSSQGKQALVVGLGPIGILACMVLKLRGFDVLAQDVVDSHSSRVQIIEEMGCTYIDGRQTNYSQIVQQFKQIDVIIEAVGVAVVEFALLEALGFNGVCVVTGVPDEHHKLTIPEAQHIMPNLVLKNQVLVGSVNASKRHWELAVDDLEKAGKAWPDAMSKIITSKIPYDHVENVFKSQSNNEIKTVITWDL